MKKHRNTCYCPTVLAVLASCGLGVVASAEPKHKDAPKPLSPEIVKAWRDAGAAVAWMKDVPPQMDAYRFWEPWRGKEEAGAMPAFRFPERNAGGVLAKLPDPEAAFGLDFHCGFYAGATLKELAKFKNLQSLSIGGVQGKATDVRHKHRPNLPVLLSPSPRERLRSKEWTMLAPRSAAARETSFVAGTCLTRLGSRLRLMGMCSDYRLLVAHVFPPAWQHRIHIDKLLRGIHHFAPKEVVEASLLRRHFCDLSQASAAPVAPERCIHHVCHHAYRPLL
jgi:hypothetical protein